MARHYLVDTDFTSREVSKILKLAAKLKKKRKPLNLLKGKTLIMLFEKSSTRTRLSFEVGMTQLGGHAIFVDSKNSQLGRGESLRDTASVFSRYGDMVMARVYSHTALEEMARFSTIPIINGLSDLYHPCQSMADIFTVLEHKKKLKGLKVAFVGDGNNNVIHSLMLMCAHVGADVWVGCPKAYEPMPQVVEKARELAAKNKSTVNVTSDPIEAVRDADVVCTDVWVSMGHEAEKEARMRDLRPFQVNAELTSHAKPDYIFLHCLPAHVGEEVTDDIIYSKHSVVFDEAENRLHVQNAMMVFLTKGMK